MLHIQVHQFENMSAHMVMQRMTCAQVRANLGVDLVSRTADLLAQVAAKRPRWSLKSLPPRP
jgi:hypothetical protein